MLCAIHRSSFVSLKSLPEPGTIANLAAFALFARELEKPRLPNGPVPDRHRPEAF